VLKLTSIRADTNIAFTEDTVPRFPIPTDLLSAYILEPLANVLIPMQLAEACTTEDIASAIRDLYRQNQLLVDQVKPRDGWTDGVFANLNLMPVLYKLLSIQYDPLEQDSIVKRHTAYRAGAILYLSIIRLKFGINLSASLHIRNLKEALGALEDLNIDCDLTILLWLLVVGGTQSTTTREQPEEHGWFVSKLTQVIIFMGCNSWEQVMSHVRGVLWADGLAEENCDELRGEVRTKAWSLYGQVFA
jgi:hypothetical protein